MTARVKPSLALLLATTAFALLLAVGLIARPADLVEVAVIAAFGTIMLLWVFEWGRERMRGPRAAMPFPLDCAIIPRRDLNSDELKELGVSLAAWWRAECAAPGSAVERLDEDALNDLLAGELPQPFGLRLLGWFREPGAHHGITLPRRLTAQDMSDVLRHARDSNPTVARRIPPAELRAVFLGLCNYTEPAVRRLLAGLRRRLPADLLEDVLIDGRSWDDPHEAPPTDGGLPE
jgi:hypothetical protein